ncbi:glycosyltransferase [Paludibacter sp. 221]|uniref:glycosyltransferase n=1 Tax=Paludibacter sp. 221 TaxID=2302939 RepID=UPI0013D54B87|nr:glycosyltransferase [Paludibacter sp. 221]NDV47694.1 glycosyltransferase [Paludibacter sp. 221]
MWLITTTTILIALYIILIRIFKAGWKNMDDFHPHRRIVESDIKVSVVVACKNEEKSLPHLIQGLRNQSYKDFELILVNDHSTDHTAQIMQESLSRFENAVYIESDGQGKKAAIAKGIKQASGELIITTDADCSPKKTWIQTIVDFQIQNPSHLIICPVKLSGRKGIFSHLQQFEFTSLTASGAGAAGAQMPIMCNAANLAFPKEAWLKSQKDLKMEEQSGDDMFLLQSIKKRGGIIRFLRSKEAFVETEPAKNLKAFVRQRRRWAGKSTAYTDWHLIFTACVVFGVCLAQLLLLIFSFFNILYLYIFLLFFVLKYWVDTQFLNEVSDFYSLKSVEFYSFCLSVIYPFYIVFTAISAIVFKPKKW